MTEDHLARMIFSQAGRYGEHAALCFKRDGQWRSLSWYETGERIRAVAKGLLALGVGEQECVGIFSLNCAEWCLADYAVQSIRAISVPIHASSTASQAAEIAAEAGIAVLFAGSEAQLGVARGLMKQGSTIKKVIVLDARLAAGDDEGVMSFDELAGSGELAGNDAQFFARLNAASPADISNIIYTSGTSGESKGAVLTHECFRRQLESFRKRFPLGADDIALSFLPLSHVYGKTMDYLVQSGGGTVYYCEELMDVVEGFSAVRPTYMAGVPRLYERMYRAIRDNLLKKGLAYRWALRAGRRYNYRRYSGRPIPLTARLAYALADRMALKRIRDMLGGRIHWFSAGGAPLSGEVEDFFLAAGVFIGQGYGLTETCSAVCVNYPGRFKFGTVGTPMDGIEVRVADDGEVMVKGPTVMSGYYKKPVETQEAFTPDGWLKTGDTGYLDDEGFLRITGRKKDLIVTAGGKNVAPQRIESIITGDSLIEQAAVVGDGRKYITALVVPAFESLEAYARENGIGFARRDDLLQDPAIVRLYRERIDTLSEPLANYERIRRFTLLTREFSQESGEVTPTMKLRRKAIDRNYHDVIEAMYAEDAPR